MVAKLRPNRVRRTYLGGGRIDAFTGFAANETDGIPRPEDWLASTTTAFNGTTEIEGEGLGQLEDGRFVKEVAGTMPILTKLLDSDERLVIQAHPTVPYAKEKLNSPVGKTECWYFLEGTAPDACVYLGFKPGITKEKWKAAFEAQEGMLEMLHRVPVKAGDFVFVDGGVPHAIGGGCFMIELQEPSDLMVVSERATPSGRVIPEQKLHCGLGFEEMFNVYEYRGYGYEELCDKYVKRDTGSSANVEQILGTELTDKFSEYLISGGELKLPRASGVAVATAGVGKVNGLDVQKGDRLVFFNEQQLVVSGGVKVVVCV